MTKIFSSTAGVCALGMYFAAAPDRESAAAEKEKEKVVHTNHFTSHLISVPELAFNLLLGSRLILRLARQQHASAAH